MLRDFQFQERALTTTCWAELVITLISLILGGGQDTISDYDTTAGNVDTLRFGAGIKASDIVFAQNGFDLVLSIKGTTDQVTISNWGMGDAYQIEQMAFADGTVWNSTYLRTRLSEVPITGTSGNDYLQGNAWSNTLSGGAGNDNLNGGLGNDTYLFNLGGGQDTINEWDPTNGNIDTLRFGAGITANNITLTRVVDSLVLGIQGTNDQVTVANWGWGDAYHIERVEFADGTVWNSSYLQACVSTLPILGTSGDDIFTSYTTGNNTFIGGKGNDFILAGAGNETYVFNLGDGQDTISDAGGSDTIRFGAGISASNIVFARSGTDLVLGVGGTTDQITVGAWGDGNFSHIEHVEFADGTIWDSAYMQSRIPSLTSTSVVGTQGDDELTSLGWSGETSTLQGLGGDDLIWGSGGDDILIGGLGNDRMYGGEGNDTYIFNLGDGKDRIHDYGETVGNIDTLRFGAGIAASDIAFSRLGGGLVLNINGTNDQVEIAGIERVEFADGAVWDATYLQAQASVPITNLSGVDDSMNGGVGNDTYLFNLGDGQDTIYEYDTTAGNVDTLRFGEGITGANISVSRNGFDLVLSINGTTDQITIAGWGYDEAYRIERVEFTNGTVWDSTHLQAQAAALPITWQWDIHGDVGNNTYLFNAGDSTKTITDYDATIGNVDTLRFGAGIASKDIVFSRSGNDLMMTVVGTADQVTIKNWESGDANRIERVEFADGTVWDTTYLQANASAIAITGTSGNDILYGDVGSNTYLFSLGGGQDKIYDFDTASGNIDTLRFGAGIASSNIAFSRAGNDLVLSVNGTNDQVTIANWGLGDANHIECVGFADGVIWDLAYLQAQASAVFAAGTASITGTGGDDLLIGDSGNNVFDGGIGNDYLQGGQGNDTYLFNLGGGQDTINDYDSTNGNLDTLRFGVGITADDISFSRSGNDIVLGINGTSDQVTIQNWITGDAYRIEKVAFADGTVWDSTYLQAQTAIVADVGSGIPINHAPVTNVDTAAVQEDITVIATGNVLANDSDVDQGTVLSVGNGGTFQGLYGTFTLNSDGNYSYAVNTASLVVQSLAAGQVATDTFTYQVTDGLVATPSSLVVSITGTNDIPLAVVDTNVTQEDLQLVAVGNVLANDSDVDKGTLLSVSNAGAYQGVYGTLLLQSDGSYTYILNNASLGVQSLAEGQVVTDTFTYQATDGIVAIPSTLVVSITGTNDAPITTVDTAAIQEGNTIVTGNVLANDTDADQGTVLTVANAGVLKGQYGQLTLGANGSYTYALNNALATVQSLKAGQTVTESFAYQATDGLVSTPSTLTVTVTGTNDAPLVVADVAAVQEDLSITATGNVLTNDSDVDQGTVLRVANPGVFAGQYGQLTLAADGSYTFALANSSAAVQSLNVGQSINVVYVYQATDGIATTSSTLTVTITGTNDTPVTTADTAAVQKNLMLVATGNVLTNDIDVDHGAVLSVANAGAYQGTYGTLTLNANGSYSYALNNALASVQSLTTGQTITETFAYQATDGIFSTPSTLTVTIAGINSNSAPVATADVTTVKEDINITANGNVLANDTDADAGTVLTVANAGTLQGTYGTLVLNANGNYSYALNNASNAVQSLRAGQTVTEVFAYQATDGIAITPSTLTVTITGTNDAPVVGTALAAQSITEGQTFSYVLPANSFTDIDTGDALTYSATLAGGAALPTWLSFNAATRTFSGTPVSGSLSNLSIVVTAIDSGGLSASSSFGLAVNATVITGTTAADTLTGTAYDDLINGLAGADKMSGGLGNDTYIVDNVGDVVTEAANAGIDTVQSSVTYTLATNVENLILTGTTAINGTGNALDNVLDGSQNTAANILTGGAGNDTYILGTGDTIVEAANAGTDTVMTAATYTLGANLENLILTGTAAINGTGNTLNNVLTGNSAANILSGGAGADTMIGGAGNDTYVVDNVGDIVTELLNEGTDLVQSSVTYTLSANVENLTLTGTTAINGTGNELDNILTGNSGVNTLIGGAGNDTLNGGAGADKLIGGLGNDTYIVDNVGDVITENLNEGIDTVQSSVTYTLATNVENLILTGTTAINGTGNALDNVLDGSQNTAANILTGGAGNDTYILGTGDTIVEAANAGTDTVMTAATYTLGANLENLILTGTAAINGTGNSVDNIILGNTANNTLSGGTGNDMLFGDMGNDTINGDAGNDILQGGGGNDSLTDTAGNNLLDGGAGTDTLTGNTGNEIFIGGQGNDVINAGSGSNIIAFNKGDGLDTVNCVTGTSNTISLGGNFAFADLALQKSGSDLILDIGASDSITLKNWYVGIKGIVNLQVVETAMSDFNPGSMDVLRNSNVENFDFQALVAAFDQAQVANPSLNAWSVTNDLLTTHLASSDTAALGGDLAYVYGSQGSLTGFNVSTAESELSNTQFATAAQTLNPWPTLNTGTAQIR